MTMVTLSTSGVNLKTTYGEAIDSGVDRDDPTRRRGEAPDQA
jgi:hypothetical protein